MNKPVIGDVAVYDGADFVPLQSPQTLVANASQTTGVTWTTNSPVYGTGSAPQVTTTGNAITSTSVNMGEGLTFNKILEAVILTYLAKYGWRRVPEKNPPEIVCVCVVCDKKLASTSLYFINDGILEQAIKEGEIFQQMHAKECEGAKDES